MNNGDINFPLFETKPSPPPVPSTKIVEAYGLQKCPRLVEQVADKDISVRINALAVVCDEFQNPYVIEGCARAGIVQVLASMISDPDYTTRVRSSMALSTAAADANGLAAILLDEAIPDILQGMNDTSVDVRRNVYQCLHHVTRTMDGVRACVKAGVTVEFVTAVSAEDDVLKPIMLQTIHNSCKIEAGLQDALESQAVKKFIDLLRTTTSTEVTLQAARALGFICFSDVAKEAAIAEKGIAVMVPLLQELPSEEVMVALTFALMAITSTDEGKIQLSDCDGVSVLIQTLQQSKRLVKLNVLKVISNLAVYPQARCELNMDTRGMEPSQLAEIAAESKTSDDDDDRIILTRTPHASVVGVIRRLQEEADESGDVLLRKHAAIALEAVQWDP
eukprot:CAMPEP_0185020200 /NCGR_PEP_ID=MMETSP1103-20130426/2803_1 /TAXON_ID=36769 /ORGANISM="Paraphysomonas bandaiensis, Strain Caron Lab Isolate" /LENGTH=390 /DNA_ID=CAMNT_0027550959 /DNA_START=31 /DNA_END=1203 /DNA_ORIENTATION=-